MLAWKIPVPEMYDVSGKQHRLYLLQFHGEVIQKAEWPLLMAALLEGDVL